MAVNEPILVAVAIISASLVYAAWRFDKSRLYSLIVIFLILISLTGGKIVEFFGFATNTGHVFYASVFLATYFLIERYGKKEGARSILIGVLGLFFFSILARLTVALTGTEATLAFDAALSDALAPAPRLAIASGVAYIFSQSLNVYVYTYLKTHHESWGLWLRANVSNACAQVLDSIIFFTIAFSGVVAPQHVLEVMLTGIVIKILFMVLAAPLLYLNNVEEDSDEIAYSSITLR